MMTFLEFTFRSFWHFIGVLILVSAVANIIIKNWASFWRHRTISKHGYPPPHCDADGAQKLKREEE
jgi:hypothetical protein